MHLLMIPNNIIDKIYLTSAFKEQIIVQSFRFIPIIIWKRNSVCYGGEEKKRIKKTKYWKALTHTWNDYSISKFLNANKNCIRNKVIYLISFLITWNETQMHDLIFMYQPKPPLSLQRKGKEKKRNMLTTGYSATSISRAFAELMSPWKNIEKKLLLHAQKAKICSKVK